MNRNAALAVCALFAACTTDIPLGTPKSCRDALVLRACNDATAPATIDWGQCQENGKCSCLDGAELTDAGLCRPATACDGGLCANPSPVCTPGRDQECNEDLSMSSLAGTCGADGRCTCGAAFEPGPIGRCRPAGSFCLVPDAGVTRADGGAPPTAGSCEGSACGLGGRCEADAGEARCVASTNAGCFSTTCGAVSCGAGCRCADADAGFCACPPPDRCLVTLPATCSDELDAFAAVCSRPDGGSSVCTCNEGYTLDPRTHHCVSDFVLTAIDTPVGSLAIAPVPGETKVGVAYLAALGDAGFLVRYVEVTADGGASAPRTVATIAHDFGVALAFDSAGEPAIGFLGGSVGGTSSFWTNSDAMLARRSGTVFTTGTVATGGAQALCGNPVSDRGEVVGLYPALGFDSQGESFFAWRDVHEGQFPQQDFAASDLEVAKSSGAGWTYECARAGGNDRMAWGAHARLVMANDAPAIVSDQLFGVAAGDGQNVKFVQRQGAGTWSAPVEVFTQAVVVGGPAMAWDAVRGYQVVAQDGNGDVRLATSNTGVLWGIEAVAAGGAPGSGPDVAVDPLTHVPYVAVARAGSLRLFHQEGNVFVDETVVSFATARPRLAVLPNGQRVVAFVDTANGFLRVAVER